jgi:hypothetical protein
MELAGEKKNRRFSCRESLRRRLKQNRRRKSLAALNSENGDHLMLLEKQILISRSHAGQHSLPAMVASKSLCRQF